MASGREEAQAAPGRIVILNGAPRSGKSSLARAIQESLPGTWLNTGVDSFMAALPPAIMPGIGLRPGGERPDLEASVAELYDLLFSTIARQARAGFDVVADLGMHEDYAVPLGILDRAAARLGPLGALLVGIDCDLDEIMRRRNADPQGGFYAAGEGIPDPVRRWQEAVHVPGIYDLVVDTGTTPPEACAQAIAAALANPPEQRAFEKLAAMSPAPSAPAGDRA